MKRFHIQMGAAHRRAPYPTKWRGLVGANTAPTGIFSMKRLTTAQRCAVDPHPGGRGAQSCAPYPTKRRVDSSGAIRRSRE